MGEAAKNLPYTLEDWIELEVACLNERVTLEQIYDDVALELNNEEDI